MAPARALSVERWYAPKPDSLATRAIDIGKTIHPHPTTLQSPNLYRFGLWATLVAAVGAGADARQWYVQEATAQNWTMVLASNA